MSLAVRTTEVPEPFIVPPSDEFDGSDGSWSTFKISVGSPGQDFRVLPSTKAGVTYVIAPDGCLDGVDPPDCPQLRGIEVFNSAQNIGFQVNESSTWSAIGEFEVDLEEALNYTGRGLFGTDTVSLGAAADRSSSLLLTDQIVGAIADPDYYMGMIGLGQAKSSFNSGSPPVDSFLYALRQTKKIPSFAYAYTAGARYRLKSVFGSLILGGYDATRFEPSTDNFSFTFSQDPSRLLTVGVASILATNTLQGTYSLTSGAHFSVIDSTVPHLWLPEDVCAEFETAFGLTYDPQTDLYLVNHTVHEELVSKRPTITIKLVNSLNDATTNYTNIELPYAAFDLQASYPFYENATNYFPIRRAANESQYALGRALLQEAYLIVDYERANFTVAQAVFPDPLPAAEVITITSPSESPATQPSSSGLGTGAIVGIAIGVVAVIAAAVFAFFFFRKRRSKTQKQERHELAGKHISEVGSGIEFPVAASPHKATAPQELGGTPLTELASPVSDHFVGHAYPQDQKMVINVTDEPQELHGESRVPATHRWREVHAPAPPYQHDMDAESSASNTISAMPSDDGHSISEFRPQSGVSPLTPRFPQNRHL
ncbi:peptidase aspartic protein [Stemphylium lycopersici]|uniref:Acid protease n=1 Tax=Stemphylium lycopersici TaxID=183478 RepID=A0A364NGJ8_STELY|nr:peptidase aspartic protein [Stemphylium lycopersici]RAR16367.1 acid protease [Stemphylium lycopersici]